jgi:hypothetical protein
MGLSKTRTKDNGKVKTSDFLHIDSKGEGKGKAKDKTPNENTQKEKNKALNSLMKGMEQSGLTTKDKSQPWGVRIDMFLKIPGVNKADLKGVSKPVLNEWINSSPEMREYQADNAPKPDTKPTSNPVGSAARVAKGPGWISVTRLLGKARV